MLIFSFNRKLKFYFLFKNSREKAFKKAKKLKLKELGNKKLKNQNAELFSALPKNWMPSNKKDE
jgi:hypothetical protein